MLKDFKFLVQCNAQPAIEINVVAESYKQAARYAKYTYAQEHTTYADDRYNKWFIKEVNV